MKYSLRSLMIAVTLICVVLGLVGARIGYLRRWAAFHKRKAEECVTTINAVYGEEGREPDDKYHDLLGSMLRHTILSTRYEFAAYHHPWTITNEDDFSWTLPNSSAPAPNPPKP
jgi:hypothetical protein